MASLRDIRKRIDSVKNTSQITKAMKMVSAAYLRRSQERLDAIRPYCDKTAEITSALAQKSETKDHPLLAMRPAKKVLVAAISSDRGLCGGFNSNLLRKLESQLIEWNEQGLDVSVITIGRKARDYFKRRPQYNVIEKYTEKLSSDFDDFAGEFSDRLADAFLEESADEVWLAYNYFRSAISQIPTIEKLLPYELEPVDDEKAQSMIDFLYEPSKEDILEYMLSRNVKLRLLRSFSESVTAEHAARMTAMDNSTNNARDMIDRLTLKYNRARQEAITRELMEIIGGAEALSG